MSDSGHYGVFAMLERLLDSNSINNSILDLLVSDRTHWNFKQANLATVIIYNSIRKFSPVGSVFSVKNVS